MSIEVLEWQNIKLRLYIGQNVYSNLSGMFKEQEIHYRPILS